MIVEEIFAGESKNVEYKVSRPEKSIKYMKTVVAFANGKGRHIIFGVDDKTRNVKQRPYYIKSESVMSGVYISRNL